MKQLLIWTVAEGRYKVYADLFCYCAEKAYPDYKVRVDKSEERFPGQWAAACLRFVFNPDTFFNYPYVYITDVDMMICPEETALLDFHLKEIEETGLCYSNSPRWKEPFGENRLTGLHFVTREWWTKTEEARLKYYDLLMSGELGYGKCDDELMLMKIVKDSGLPVTKMSDLLIRHHGIHLGTVRDFQKEGRSSVRDQLRFRVTKERATYWCNLIESVEYRNLLVDIKKQDKQVAGELEMLESVANQIARN